ncbi:hypothetical protein MK805_04290 [Shimazuella sp. AN120528]|uniref:hypothetical protein n=1 Tax=Shimazuella soli TaxID=1892854 RepID=UPI001F0EBA71|nr:hypothetical protein [Shimazuella soli]MCH5584186.1 hypothetical protein [Shimazuella soli]
MNAFQSSNLHPVNFTYEEIGKNKYKFTAGKREENLDIQMKNNQMTIKFENGQTVCHYRRMKNTSGM